MSEDWRERKLNKLLEAAAPLKREDLEAILGKPLHPRDKSHIEWASKVVRDLPDGVSLQDAYEAGQALALDNLNRRKEET